MHPDAIIRRGSSARVATPVVEPGGRGRNGHPHDLARRRLISHARAQCTHPLNRAP